MKTRPARLPWRSKTPIARRTKGADDVGDYHALAIPGGFGAVFAQPRPQAMVGATDAFFASLATDG